jgi:hypothetical protein
VKNILLTAAALFCVYSFMFPPAARPTGPVAAALADASSADSQISYYLKGAVVALVLDLHLRRHGSSLGVVLRGLWRSHGAAGRGYTNAAASRELLALIYMAASSAMSRCLYDPARAAFPNSYGGEPIQCGNYRHSCTDSLPFRFRNGYSAIDGTDQDIYCAPDFLTDYYDDLQCPVIYPELDLFQADPFKLDGSFLGFNGVTWNTSVEPTIANYRAGNKNLWRTQRLACQASSIYDVDKFVPWLHWPNIGNGVANTTSGLGAYANGNCYVGHTDDFQWLVRELMLSGAYRGQIWSWNPNTQVAADADTLMDALDAAYEDVGIVLGKIDTRTCCS